MRQRVLIVGTAAAVLAAAFLYQFFVVNRPQPNGPMQISDAIEIAYPLSAGATSTWGTPIPEVEVSPTAIVDVQLLDVINVEVLGIAACVGGQLQPDGSFNHCAPINAIGWPPEGVSVLPVAGVELGTSPRNSPGLLVGVRRVDASIDGTIGAVRILYRAEGTLYEAIQPWSLRLTEPR